MRFFKIIFLSSVLSFVTASKNLVVVESKPLLSDSSSLLVKMKEFEQEQNQLLTSIQNLDFKTIELMNLSEEIMSHLEALKHKIDALERQQRDFLVLMSDVLISPEQPMTPQEDKDYQAILELMKAQQYQNGLKTLQKFLLDYPKSEKLADVHY
jgi:TolA-binding protein